MILADTGAMANSGDQAGVEIQQRNTDELVFDGFQVEEANTGKTDVSRQRSKGISNRLKIEIQRLDQQQKTVWLATVVAPAGLVLRSR